MNRLLATLLIPFLAFGNAFPHTHGEASAPADHAARPHLHLESRSDSHAVDHHGHLHHGHLHHHAGGDKGAATTIDHHLPVDHDSDALYLGTGHLYLPASVGPSVGSEIDGIGLSATVDQFSAATARRTPACFDPPQQAGPPLYLLHAALRL